MKNIFLTFNKYFPFFITLILWYLAVPVWNPAGILALIPIFYFTFVKPVDNYIFFAGMFCFLIDYRCNLLLFWTFMYILFYAINGLQNYTDLTKTNDNAKFIFMFFSGIGMFVLLTRNFYFSNFLHIFWLFLLLNILYFPITRIIDKLVQK